MSQIFDIVEELEKERKKNKELEIELKDNKDRCEILAYRINKAIYYIETYIIEDSEYENYMQCEREEKEELLNILKGDNK